MKNKGFSLDNEKGAVIIIVAILLPVLLGITAFAIDFGYTRIVRNQLQNAADAAALAGCNKFYDRTVVPDFNNPDDLLPRWNDAVAEALEAISDNYADNKMLQTGNTEIGWWDITQAYPGTLWSDPLATPPPGYPSSPDDYGPAISVAVAKTTGQNDGPVRSFFGRIFGFGSYDGISANATAVAASPGSVRPGAVVPFAISRTVADVNYDDYNDEDNLLIIGSDYHYPDSQAGQWTSFALDTNAVPDVSDLIVSGNPEALSIGDNIWMQPGVRDTLYDSQPHGNIDDEYSGEEIFFPIVDGPIETHAEAPIVGFIGFHIVCAGSGCSGMEIPYNDELVVIGANEPIVVGYFTTEPEYGGSLGPHYGPLDRCRLCE